MKKILALTFVFLSFFLFFGCNGNTTTLPTTASPTTELETTLAPTTLPQTTSTTTTEITTTTTTQPITVADVTITFDTLGGNAISPLIAESGEGVYLPDAERVGYTFLGWSLSNEVSAPLVTLPFVTTSDVTLYAKWLVNVYELTYLDYDESIIYQAEFDYQADLSEVSFMLPTRVGYSFNGWNLATPETMPANDLTITALYEINQYTITFEVDGGSEVLTITQDYNTSVVEPNEPTKEGYTFIGWFSDIELLTPYEFTLMPAEDIMLYAKWGLNSYRLTYLDYDGYLIYSELFDYQEDLSTLIVDEPVRTGYTFTGWDIITPETMPASDLTITALYEINQYTISFETNDGNIIDPITQDYNTSVTEPTEPTKIGNTFAGWFSDIELLTPYEFTLMPAEDIILYAKWDLNSYRLTYLDYDGYLIYSELFDYQEDLSTLIVDEPVRTGYTFTGWDVITPETMPANDLTITALYEINQYTISFETNDGNIIDPITQDYNTSVTAPTEPIKTGYTFAGWFSDVELLTPYEFNLMPAEDIILYAKWNINQYTISFETDGGSVVEDITQDYNSAVTEPTDPTKGGFTFDGWFSDIELTTPYEFDLMPAEDITLYAKWNIDFTVELLVDDTYKIIRYIGTDTEVIVPASYLGKPITRMEDNAFFAMNTITSISFPASITTMSGMTFYNAHGLINIFVDAENLYFSSENGVLFNKDKTTLIKYPEGRSETSYEIPSSVNTIGSFAFFYSVNLTNMIIPESVTAINRAGFMDCANLETIFIPLSVTYIGNEAFSSCVNLTIYAEALSQPSGWHSGWNNSSCPVVWGYIPE